MVRELHVISLVAVDADCISWVLLGHAYDVLLIYVCGMAFLCYSRDASMVSSICYP